MQASAAAKENAAEPAESVALLIPSPPDERKEAARADDHKARATPGELITVEAAGSELGASHDAQAIRAVAPSSPPPAEMNVAAPANSRMSPNDPLAALQSLSEEELTALFS
jgi:hypothetical protein